MHGDVCDNQINTINALLLKNNQQSLTLEIPNGVVIISLMLHFNKRCDELILCEKGKYMEKIKSLSSFIVTKNHNWSSEILDKELII